MIRPFNLTGQPRGAGLVKAGLAFAMFLAVGQGVQAQEYRDYNLETRKNTWSVYAQGGISKATGLWYSDVNASQFYKLSPAVGGGIDYNIVPWLRAGLAYTYSDYRRQQRFTQPVAYNEGSKTYGKYNMAYHNIEANVAANIMQLWPNRRAQWLNIYAGTGVGYMIAKGNELTHWTKTTYTKDGVTVPVTGGNVDIDNDSRVEFKAEYNITNRHEDFNTLFVPVYVNLEADLTRQITVGLKAQSDFLIGQPDCAAKNLHFAMATVRYNFVKSKTRKTMEAYAQDIVVKDGEIVDLKDNLGRETARADRAEKDAKDLKGKNAKLQDDLNDALSKPNGDKMHTVHFNLASAAINSTEAQHLKGFISRYAGKNFVLIGEASTDGSSDKNQTLSERRLEEVKKFIEKEGATVEVRSSKAIGDTGGIDTADGRRVVLTVE